MLRALTAYGTLVCMSTAVYTTPYAPTPRTPVNSSLSAKIKPSRSSGAHGPTNGEGGGVGNITRASPKGTESHADKLFNKSNPVEADASSCLINIFLNEKTGVPFHNGRWSGWENDDSKGVAEQSRGGGMVEIRKFRTARWGEMEYQDRAKGENGEVGYVGRVVLVADRKAK